jgi:hypothetical protein
MIKESIKKSFLLLTTLTLLSCSSGMVITAVADLSDESLNTTTTSKNDVYLVKNYKDDTEHNNELYSFGKNRWLKYSGTFKKYEVKFFKESSLINLQSIHNINSFNDYRIIDSLNKAEFIRYRFIDKTVIMEKIREGRIIFSLKKKI